MELVIKRSKWLRGEGSLNSSLLRLDQKMCCLGFYSLACGMNKEEIEDQLTVSRIFRGASVDEVPQGTRFLLEEQFDVVSGGSKVQDLLMSVNDAPIGKDIPLSIDPDGTVIESEQQREALITKIFAQNGVTVRFED